MVKHLDSFVLRCWSFPDGEQRIEIEHIQSGDVRLARTLVEAADWMRSSIALTAGMVARKDGVAETARVGDSDGRGLFA